MDVQQSVNPPTNIKTQEGFIRGAMHQYDSSVIMYQLDTAEILEELEMNLKGYDWDFKSNTYVKKRAQMVNDLGIDTFMTLLKAEVNKTKILSYYEDEDVLIIAKEFELNIVDVLAAKYQEFGIDEQLLSSVRSMWGNAVYSAYMRGLHGGERTFLRGVEQRTETYAEKEKSKSGILGLIGIGGKSKW